MSFEGAKSLTAGELRARDTHATGWSANYEAMGS